MVNIVGAAEQAATCLDILVMRYHVIRLKLVGVMI